MSAVARKVSEDLARRLGDRKYGMWFGTSTRFHVNGQRLEVVTPSRYVADWIDAHFAGDLGTAARSALGANAEVEISVVADDRERSASSPDRCADDQRQHTGRKESDVDVSKTNGGATGHAPRSVARRAARPSHQGPPLRHALSTFVVGDSNRLAYRAGRHLAESIQDGGLGPVFIYGECGLGKTHLLQGSCRLFLETHGGARVRYTTGEQFTNEYIHALQKGTIEQFRHKVRNLDLLAIDDIHFLSNKTSTQAEFLHTLDAIRMCGARIIMASDEHPRHLRQISQALVSRFMAGIVARIDRPDRAMRLELVKQFAARRGMRLNEQAAMLVASNCVGSVREIEGTLMKLEALRDFDTGGNSMNGEIGCVLVETLFRSEETRTRPIRIDAIIQAVCERLMVDRTELMDTTRHRRVVLARGLVSHLARELTTMSYPEIGRSLGRRNHSTVLTAARRVVEQVEAGEAVKLDADARAVTLADLVDQLRVEIRRAHRP